LILFSNSAYCVREFHFVIAECWKQSEVPSRVYIVFYRRMKYPYSFGHSCFNSQASELVPIFYCVQSSTDECKYWNIWTPQYMYNIVKYSPWRYLCAFFVQGVSCLDYSTHTLYVYDTYSLPSYYCTKG